MIHSKILNFFFVHFWFWVSDYIHSHLILQTGKLYYISQKTGVRVDINDNDTNGNNMAINGEMKGKSTVSAPPTLMGKAVEANNLLLLVTCNRCIKYMMVSKPTKTCPRCSGALIQFIDEKCF